VYRERRKIRWTDDFKTDFKQTIFSSIYTRMSVAVVSSSWVAKTFEDLPSAVQAAVLRYWNKEDFVCEFVERNSAARQQVFLRVLAEVERFQLTTDKAFAWALVSCVRYSDMNEAGHLYKIQMEIADEEQKKQEEEEERDARKKKMWIDEYKKEHTQLPNKPASTSMITKGMLRDVMTEFLPKRRPTPTDDKYKCDVCRVVLSSNGSLFNHKKSKLHLHMMEKFPAAS
jgi:hypothetical protein